MKKDPAAKRGVLSWREVNNTSATLDKDKKLVIIEALWNNRSPCSIYMDINMSRTDICKIPAHLHLYTPASTLKTDLGEALCSHKFLLHMVEENYFLEPNALGTIINNFVLPNGLYGARMLLHTGKKGIMWWKEIIIDTQEHIAKPHQSTHQTILIKYIKITRKVTLDKQRR